MLPGRDVQPLVTGLRSRSGGPPMERVMASRTGPVVRDAEHDDAGAICRFGDAHIRPHYAPLIGAAAADEQVRRWWNETSIGGAVAQGLVVVAEADGQLVGVGQRGHRGADHVVYKLYLHPASGPRARPSVA